MRINRDRINRYGQAIFIDYLYFLQFPKWQYVDNPIAYFTANCRDCRQIFFVLANPRNEKTLFIRQHGSLATFHISGQGLQEALQ